MPTLQDIEAATRRRRVRRWVLGIAIAPLVGFSLLVLAVALGAFRQYDVDALRRGVFLVRETPAPVPAGPRQGTGERPVAPGLRAAARAWVATFNRLNDGAITQFDVDAYGNLLLMFDARYDALAPSAQLRLLDNVGVYYRMHLASIARGLPTGRFVPGIILVDTMPGRPAIRGESRNGLTRLFSP